MIFIAILRKIPEATYSSSRCGIRVKFVIAVGIVTRFLSSYKPLQNVSLKFHRCSFLLRNVWNIVRDPEGLWIPFQRAAIWREKEKTVTNPKCVCVCVCGGRDNLYSWHRLQGSEIQVSVLKYCTGSPYGSFSWHWLCILSVWGFILDVQNNTRHKRRLLALGNCLEHLMRVTKCRNDHKAFLFPPKTGECLFWPNSCDMWQRNVCFPTSWR